MNQPESEFENELRRLRPARPAPRLESRIDEALTLAERAPTRSVIASGRLVRSEVRVRWIPWLGRLSWASGGAVATLVVLALSRATHAPQRSSSAELRTSRTAPANALELLESSTELLLAEDEGLRYASGSEPVRQMRYRFRERHAWRDAETGARVELEVPREDVRFMPVAMQ